jgi:hypothetical protein
MQLQEEQRRKAEQEKTQMTRQQRSGIAARTFNKYPSAPDGRGASTVTRKTPVGKDPLAVETGKPQHTAASR